MRILAFLLFLCFSPSIANADLGAARHAETEGNYELALKLYLEEANKGNKDAQYFLGFMFRHGKGTPVDYKESLKWFKASADQNYSLSIHEVGLIYFNGYGVESDIPKAVEYFEIAHALENPRSSEALALLYLDGHQHIKKDIDKTKFYLQQGLRFGMPLSLAILGNMYFHGTGYPENEYRAILLFIEAANLGSKSAIGILKDIENKIGMPLQTYLENTYQHTLPLNEIRICPSIKIQRPDCTIFWNN